MMSNINKSKIKNQIITLFLNISERADSKKDRELYSIARQLDIEINYIIPILKQLVDKRIIKEEQEFMCKKCKKNILIKSSSVEILRNTQSINMVLSCNCGEIIDFQRDSTGYIYYSVINRAWLEKEKICCI